MATTNENAGDMVAYTQNGRPVTYREVTTQDLMADAVRYASAAARAELTRRGIDWARHVVLP